MKRQHEKSHISARNVQSVVCKTEDQKRKLCENVNELERYGICLDHKDVAKMAHAAAMDANLTTPLTTASITTPVQFLQSWLPGFTEVITAARRIDSLVGVTTQGNWEDEEVVQGVLERTGNATIYGDNTSTPLTSWNVNYERRSIIRFEEGMTVGRLEEARAAAIRANSADNKRMAAAVSLEIQRNRVGFNGYNGGNNRTYGLLNSPFLPPYMTVPDGTGGSSEWSTKTFLEITADLRGAFQALRTSTMEQVDPMTHETTLALATNAMDYLTTVSDYGVSVREWLSENYPRCRPISAPELNDANGGDNVLYLFADSVDESGSDDQRTWVQVVPTKFQTLGVDQRQKSYTEAYSNATAGLFLKRPYAVIRRSGI